MKKNLLQKIAHFQVKHPYLTITLLIAITISLLGGVSQVRTVASLEQMMPSEISEVKAFNELRDNHLGQDMIGIIIQIDPQSTNPQGIIDVRDKEVYEHIISLKQLIDSNPDIIASYAYSDIVMMAGAQSGLNPLQLTNEEYSQIITNKELQNSLSQFINNDYSSTVIIATTDISANDERMQGLAKKIIEDIQSAGSLPGTKTKITGTPIVQQRLGVLIAKDRQTTQWLSTALVFLITMILFGTFTSAIVPIIVVTLGVNWLYGIMGYANIPISTLAGGVAAMVIGIGIDYSIHLMNKFKYERKTGKSIPSAIEEAVSDTGKALFVAAIATVLAFLAFLLGTMPEMNRFGLLMSIGVSTSFLLSIIGLPSLLIIEEKIIEKLSKKMKFGVEGEYRLKK